MIHEQIDFEQIEKRAQGMTMEQLEAAVRDILATLESADALDRSDGGNRGGRYRDESSIYRARIRELLRDGQTSKYDGGTLQRMAEGVAREEHGKLVGWYIVVDPNATRLRVDVKRGETTQEIYTAL